MKTLLKLTVASLSVFAFVQAEASSFYAPPCRSGDYLQNGVCISGPAMSPVPQKVYPVMNPVNSGPVSVIPGQFKCDGGPQVPGCGIPTSANVALLQTELAAVKNQLAKASTAVQKQNLQNQVTELQARIQNLQS